MTKKDLVKSVAEIAGLSQAQAKAAVDAVVSTVTDALAKDETVQIPGFLTLSTCIRPARVGKNPLTGETIEIAEKKVVKVKVGKGLKV